MRAFSEFIGNDTVIEVLDRQLKHDQLSSGYLFCGPAHVGKGTLARLFATRLISSTVLDPQRCLVLTAPEQNGSIPVEAIRAVRRRLLVGRADRFRRVVLIDDANRLTEAAVNALLKVMEEPPPATHFILVTPLAQLVPATIRSRCQAIYFRPVPIEDLTQSARSKTELPASTIQALARASGGRPGYLLDWLDEPDLYRRYGQMARTFAHALASADPGAADDVAEWLAGTEHEKDLAVHMLQSLVIDCITRRYGLGISRLPVLNAIIGKLIARSPLWEMRLGQRLYQFQLDLRAQVNPLLALENFILQTALA